jgi:hypothetical protein
MGYTRQVVIDILTDGSGNCTALSNMKANGRVMSVDYVKASSEGLTDGSTITVTTKDTAKTLLAITGMNATASHSVRAGVESSAGVPLVFIASGQIIPDNFVVCDEQIQCVVANGGATHTGTLYITLE